MLRYTEPGVAHDWQMTLYRTTDAADTMNMVAMLIAAYCQEHSGTPMTMLASYLQVRQQRSRNTGPSESGRQEIAGTLGTSLESAAGAHRWYSAGQG
ncbi:hypothetical protein [Streptomyces sp. C3-3]|uniref:hypothetical protein n=1 Tax=Streptomyces sp. C3-3 TaxID=2824901 RepID=UPI001B372C99|nr:hypothetical protein [Streptomyces sp. C3-3]MBQ1116459.1 hypothetical protein [Streptomyces sp. C3-3]